MKIIIWFWPWRWTKKAILLEDEQRKVTCMLICIAFRGSQSLQNICLACFELCKIHIMSDRNRWASEKTELLEYENTLFSLLCRTITYCVVSLAMKTWNMDARLEREEKKKKEASINKRLTWLIEATVVHLLVESCASSHEAINQSM